MTAQIVMLNRVLVRLHEQAGSLNEGADNMQSFKAHMDALQIVGKMIRAAEKRDQAKQDRNRPTLMQQLTGTCSKRGLWVVKDQDGAIIDIESRGLAVYDKHTQATRALTAYLESVFASCGVDAMREVACDLRITQLAY